MAPYLSKAPRADRTITDPEAWQESWDRQQEAYLPDREQRFAAMLDVVAAVAPADRPVRLLDLAGGTGSITLRALARFHRVDATVLDLDPVLLAIARATLARRAASGDGPERAMAPEAMAPEAMAPRAVVVSADLNRPDWVDPLPHRQYDAVLTATALHWLVPDRLGALYGEIREVLRPGGVFINADHMPEEALPALTKRMVAAAEARRAARYAAGAALSWDEWWQRAAADAELAPLVEQRREVYPGAHAAEWMPPAGWHLDALRTAGFAEAGIVWRGGPDAAVAALR